MAITLIERYSSHGSNSTSLLDTYSNGSTYPAMMTSLEAVLVVLALVWIMFCLSTYLGARKDDEKRAQESLYLQLRVSVHQALQGGSNHIRYAETPSGLGHLGD